MGKGGFFYLFFPFPVGRADAVNSFAEEGSYASAFCFVVFYGCASVFGGEDVNVVSRFEMDVFGMYGAAFDGYVFFGDDSGCSSCGDGASFGFFGDGFRLVFPSGAAQADIDSYGIVLINGFVCFLVFLYVSRVHACLQGIRGFQPVYYLFIF